MLRESNNRLEVKLKNYKMIGLGKEFLTVRALKRSIDGALGPLKPGCWLLIRIFPRVHCAYAAFEETSKGSLVAGKLADIVVLSNDLLNCPPEEITINESTYDDCRWKNCLSSIGKRTAE